MIFLLIYSIVVIFITNTKSDQFQYNKLTKKSQTKEANFILPDENLHYRLNNKKQDNNNKNLFSIKAKKQLNQGKPIHNLQILEKLEIPKGNVKIFL